VVVSDTTLAVEFDDGDKRVIRRTTTQPVRSVKASDREPQPQAPSHAPPAGLTMLP
jgi:hypothetical protein